MSIDDEELIAEIEAFADKVEGEVLDIPDILAFATNLAQRFEHHTVDEIHHLIKCQFDRRGLFWPD